MPRPSITQLPFISTWRVNGVTGHCHQLWLRALTISLNRCGLFQGRGNVSALGAEAGLTFNLESVTLVHAVHIDHIGRFAL